MNSLIVALVLQSYPAPVAAQTLDAATRASVAIEYAAVVPMDRDTVLLDHTVLIEGDRIVWVGPSRQARIASGTRRIDGTGRWLLPGLADMHVHLRSRDDLPRFVASGITSIRNMNGKPAHIEWRNAIAQRVLAGPTVYTAGPAIWNAFFRRSPDHVRIRSAAEAVALVRAQKGAGYDMIKVQNGIKPQVFSALLEAARSAQIPVVGHVVSNVGLERSVTSGQVSFEHALSLVEDIAELPAAVRSIVSRRAWVGTLVSDRSGRCAPPDERARAVVSALRSGGARLLAGTDANIGPIDPATALRCELVTLVAAGLTPFEALASATREPGDFARLHLKSALPAGTVTVGARADLLLLGANPLQNVAAASEPLLVILKGVPQSRP